MEEHKAFYTTTDIAFDLSISEEEAIELVKKLHKELKAFGKLVVSDKVLHGMNCKKQKDL